MNAKELLLEVASDVANESGVFNRTDVVDYFESPQILNSAIGSLIKSGDLKKVEVGIYLLTVPEVESAVDELVAANDVDEKSISDDSDLKEAVSILSEHSSSPDFKSLAEQYATKHSTEIVREDSSGSFRAYRFKRNKLGIRSFEQVLNKEVARIYTGKKLPDVVVKELEKLSSFEIKGSKSYNHYTVNFKDAVDFYNILINA